MKTIEEKAKAYDEALKRANKVNKGNADDREPGITICEYIFPELKESEDEKIRKEFCKDIRTFIPIEKANKYIAWLEKQGKQKVSDSSQTCKMGTLMTLDEAIEYCKEKSCNDTLCGKEHKQLAEWLIELKGYRASATQETQKTFDKDEKIKKALIEFFGEQCDMSDWNGVYGYQVFAWLEKQGHMLDPDKVIEWLRQNNCAACWDNPDEGISQRIEQFKKDFQL